MRRFALLIPAHDEELRLPRLLNSISKMEYAKEQYDVFVVVDNCIDQTARVANQAGARVYERRDDTKRGKGFALQSLLSSILATDHDYDAFVILDADSVVSADFLEVMNRHLERGDQAIQSGYAVLNADESWASGISYVALCLFNGLRPRGRDAIGLSTGLAGNGMCFAAPVMERFGWNTFGLAEDAEFHLTLARAGIRVRCAPEATVFAEQPTSLRQAKSQSLRWERGRLQGTLREGPKLLRESMRRRNKLLLGILGDYIVPQLSILTALVVADAVVVALFREKVPVLIAGGVVLGLTAYVVAGLRLAHAKPRAYLALFAAPWYVCWKIWTIMIAASRVNDSRWVRTARTPGERAGE
jgi:cellulose synthase/poly-beta-1,6-N-acetylglucosamine synthase-like glycosyltransferase